MTKTRSYLVFIAVSVVTGCCAADDPPESFWDWTNAGAYQSPPYHVAGINPLIPDGEPHLGSTPLFLGGEGIGSSSSAVDAGSTDPHMEPLMDYHHLLPQMHLHQEHPVDYHHLLPQMHLHQEDPMDYHHLLPQMHLHHQALGSSGIQGATESNMHSFRAMESGVTQGRLEEISGVPQRNIPFEQPTAIQAPQNHLVHNHASYSYPSEMFINPAPSLNMEHQGTSLEMLDDGLVRSNDLTVIPNFDHDSHHAEHQTSIATQPFNLKFDLSFLARDVNKLSITESAIHNCFRNLGETNPHALLKIPLPQLINLANNFHHGIKIYLDSFMQKTSQEEAAKERRQTRERFLQDKWRFFKEDCWNAYFLQKKIPNYEYYLHAIKRWNNKHFESIFPCYLFYVEMITEVVPDLKESQTQLIDRNSLALANACELFYELAQSFHQKPGSSNRILLEESISALEKRSKWKKNGYDRQMSSVWNFLEFWMANSRSELFEVIRCSENSSTNMKGRVKTLFNFIFATIIEDLTEKMTLALGFK